MGFSNKEIEISKFQDTFSHFSLCMKLKISYILSWYKPQGKGKKKGDSHLFLQSETQYS